jgi:hypothetical protein
MLRFHNPILDHSLETAIVAATKGIFQVLQLSLDVRYLGW